MVGNSLYSYLTADANKGDWNRSTNYILNTWLPAPVHSKTACNPEAFTFQTHENLSSIYFGLDVTLAFHFRRRCFLFTRFCSG